METLRQIRYAFRTLRRNRLYAAVSIFTLALGIGASTLIFSAVNAILLRPLPYHQDGQIVFLFLRDVAHGNDRMPFSVPELHDFRQQSQTLDGVAAYYEGNFNITSHGQPEQIPGMRVTVNLLPLLGTKPVLGRNFLPEEEFQSPQGGVVILSHRLWTRRFNANPDILNQAVTMNGLTYRVVGVMSPDFYSPDREAELWVPLLMVNSKNFPRSTRLLHVMGRLKPDVTLPQAQTELATIAARLEQSYNENKGMGATAVSMQDFVFRDIRLPLQILLGAAGFLLLIVCANVTSLQLARAAIRGKEVALRAALGANRRHLIRQLMIESLVLALLGGVLGLLLAFGGNRLLLAFSPHNVPRMDEIGIDYRVLVFALVVSVLTSLLFGIIPALRTSKPDLQEGLKEGTQGLWGIGGRGIFKVVVVSEVALAVVLLTGAGLLVKSFRQLRAVNPGFDPENVVTMQIALPPAKYRETPKIVTFFEQLVERVRALPGVKYAGVTQSLPLGSGDTFFMALDVPGRTDPQQREGRPFVAYFQVSPDYFPAIGASLLDGRFFTDEDSKPGPPTTIINEKVASFYFPNENPIGKSIRAGSPDGWGPELTIIGVVADIRFEELARSPAMQIYTLHSKGLDIGFSNTMILAARTSSDPATLIAPIREQVWALDKDQPVAKVATMENVVSDSLARRRFIMILLGAFAAMALILASLGIYGVISYFVVQRGREIGIRMALGAERRSVLMMVMKQGMTLVLSGIAIGLAGAYLLTRLIASLLYGVTTRDPMTFIVTPLILAAVALLAISIPALKATKVDPLRALRYE
ncbi:MAG TPA: ABC transporter permease [Candidatus Saccharimonadales bacterium]|nr:ABC transporter permease [Candidatus Saccharimonadales bacterium]